MTETAAAKQEAQSAPEAENSPWRELRGQILVWIGIVGGALTLVNYWSNFITLANWMHWLVSNFSEIMHRLWSFLGALIGIRVPPGVAKLLTFIAFYSSIIIGARGLGRPKKKAKTWLSNNSYGYIRIMLILIILSGLSYSYKTPEYLEPIIATTWIFVIPLSFILITQFEVERTSYFLLVITAVVTNGMLRTGLHESLMSYKVDVDNIYLYSFYTGVLVILFPILFASPQAIAKRLGFMLIGIAIIFGLSEFSKFVASFQTAAPS